MVTTTSGYEGNGVVLLSSETAKSRSADRHCCSLLLTGMLDPVADASFLEDGSVVAPISAGRIAGDVDKIILGDDGTEASPDLEWHVRDAR